MNIKQKNHYRRSSNLKGVTTGSILAIAIALGLSACGGKSSPEAELSSAQTALAAADLSKASIHFRNVLQSKPNDPNARLGFGQVSLLTGDFNGAVAEFERAIEAGAAPDKVVPLILEALGMGGELKTIKEATQKWSNKVTTNDNKALLLAYQARADFAMGKPDEAKAAIASALQTKPDLIEAQAGQIVIALSTAQTQEAQQAALNQAIALSKANPTQSVAQSLAGYALRLQGRNAEAIPFLELALQTKAYDIATRGALVRSLVEVQNFPKAEEQLHLLSRFGAKGPTFSYLVALTAQRQGQRDRAYEAIIDVTGNLPQYVPGLELATLIALDRGDLSGAQNSSKALIALAPGSTVGYRLMAATHLAGNSPEQALSVLTPLIQNKVHSPDILALTGEALIQTGDAKRGMQFLDAAYQASGNAPGLAAAAAQAKLGTGDASAAIALLSTAAEKNKSAGTDLTIARSFAAAGELTKAKEIIERFMKASPQDPQGPFTMGMLHMKNKSVDAAKVAFGQALKINSRHWPSVDALAELDFQSNQVDAAKKRYSDISQAFPQDPTPHLALAKVAARSGAPAKEVQEHFAQARKAGGDGLAPTVEESRYLVANGQAQAAVTMLAPLESKFGDTPDFRQAQANAFEAASEPIKAALAIEHLLKTNPNSTALQFQSGKLRLAGNDLSGAMAAFQKANQLQPNAIEPKVAMASTLFNAGRKAEAYAAANAMAAQADSQVVGTSLLGDFQLAEGKVAEALASYKRVFATVASPAGFNKLYRAHLANNQPEEARTLLRDWVGKNPKDIETMIMATGALLDFKQWKDAAAVAALALKVNPKSSGAMNNAAIALQEMGNPQALTMAENAYAIEPNNPSIQDTYGWLLVKAGKKAQGLALLQSAAEKLPRDAGIKQRIAEAMKAGS